MRISHQFVFDHLHSPSYLQMKVFEQFKTYLLYAINPLLITSRRIIKFI